MFRVAGSGEREIAGGHGDAQVKEVNVRRQIVTGGDDEASSMECGGDGECGGVGVWGSEGRMERGSRGWVGAPEAGGTTGGGEGQVDWSRHVGRISGQVVDAEGEAVAGAEVMASPVEGGIGPIPSAASDERGRFVLRAVKVGETYMVTAMKTEAGYLSPCHLVLGCPTGGTCPKVTLTSSRREAEVTIRFGPRGGYVRGTVRDARTGRPVVHAVITFYGKKLAFSRRSVQADERGSFFSGGLPLCPLRMKVEAAGYHPWYYGGVGDEAAAADVVVASGETRRVEVWLRPEK